MPTNFPSWGHGREGLESHFREKLQIPYFWSRVRPHPRGAKEDWAPKATFINLEMTNRLRDFFYFHDMKGPSYAPRLTRTKRRQT